MPLWHRSGAKRCINHISERKTTLPAPHNFTGRATLMASKCDPLGRRAMPDEPITYAIIPFRAFPAMAFSSVLEPVQGVASMDPTGGALARCGR